MAVKWTEDQQKVIDTRNCDILVSAAAGSGKTAVLVARILDRILDRQNPVDIDRLLVVTFTNAAAAEMRERIRDALERRAEEEPDNIHLQKQLILVHNAKITTIHSFCLNILRSHFQAAGIDPAFRIADTGEVLLLEQDTAKETVDAAFEEGDPEFQEFLELFVPGKSDHIVEELILKAYRFVQGQPWPKEYLQRCREMYEQDTPRFWMDDIVKETGILLQDIAEQVRMTIRVAEEPDGPYFYLDALQSDREMIEKLRKASTYETLAAAFDQMPSFARLPAKRDSSISAAKKEKVKKIRDEIKSALASIRKNYFYDKEEILLKEYYDSGLSVRVLTRLTEQYMEHLKEKKAEKNILDFSDMEHLALKVLISREDGRNIPTSAAKEYAESFDEVMIDEYQDSNLVQELILSSVSGQGRGTHNRFMVGDVKQSIYRFRLARPELFMEKYRTYGSDGETTCRIDLHQNFRSRAGVLSCVNDIFRQIMTQQLGGVVYDSDAALYPGAVFAPKPGDGENQAETEFLLMQTDAENKKEDEAVLIGKRIQEIVAKEQVWDKELEQYRPARYGDIVILLRTVNEWAEIFSETLMDMGIPCFTGSQKGYFSTAEIRTILCYLQILDNPRQDIPLAAVLRNLPQGFTDEELAIIRNSRQEEKNELFYDCCIFYRESGPDDSIRKKLDHFFEIFEKLRKKSGHTPVHLLLWEILDETGYGEYAQALPGGRQRKANLDMLVEKAIAYEATSYRGLFHFVRYIENLKKYEVDYGEASIGAEADDTVRIMSIHKSKGLEFPIVFVGGLGKQFNESDVKNKVVFHPELGIACDHIDPELRTKQATLLKKAIQQRILSENLGEELRVLYVAMTRAKEKLILTGTMKDALKSIEKWGIAAGNGKEQLSYSCLSTAKTYLDWLVPALLRHPDSKRIMEQTGYAAAEFGISSYLDMKSSFVMTLVDVDENKMEEEQKKFEDSLKMQQLINLPVHAVYDEAAAAHLKKVFASEYMYESDREIIGKLSVSELKRLSQIPEETEAGELYQPEVVVPLLPKFLSGQEAITGAARGTVYHLFMENLDYFRTEELEIQLEELISCGKMTREERAVLNKKDIRRFLETQSGKRMKQAALRGQLFREHPFVLGIPASQIRSHWNPQETVLVQGIIDAWFIEDGEIVVLDYKTDRVNSGADLIEKYSIQLDYYARALQRLIGLPVKERIIYSFCLGEDIVL